LNYLAHAFLSFDHEEILVGNMVSDFVKGKAKFNFPDNIQKGITLHRAIDSFTDTHQATLMAKTIFRPHYRLYSGAFIDVVYDHFLANDPKEFAEETLRNFSERVYAILDRHVEYLPERFLGMFSYMKSQNWLFNYRSRRGTEASFRGLVRRAKYIDEGETAGLLLEKNYEVLHKYYTVFFPDVKSFAYKMYEDILKL
jgi:acyl carrier protein phosphodiesterase